MHTTIAVLMHFVITPTDTSIAHVNLDLQEMEKTAQVVFSVLRVFSYGSRNLSLLFSYLPVLHLSSYSNATTGVDSGEVDWEAIHLLFFSRLTGLLKQFNWHFFPVLCLISCTARKRKTFL